MKTPTSKSIREWTEPKVKKQPTPKQKLRKDLHKFIDDILIQCECPSNWPLSQQEQIGFVRRIIYQAKQIRNTEGYLAEAVEMAAEDLAMAS